MSEYRLTEGALVIRALDGASIPPDPLNVDRMAYEAWLAAGGAPEPYEPPPEPVPATISDRQFFQQAAIGGFITEAEALAAVATGAIPDALETFVSGLPGGDQFNARMLLSGATVFERAHPMTAAIGAAWGMTSEQVDEFFREAAGL